MQALTMFLVYTVDVGKEEMYSDYLFLYNYHKHHKIYLSSG